MKLSNKPLIFCMLLLIVIGTSCKNRHHRVAIPPKECIALNNEGVDYLMSPPWKGDNLLNKAISKFEQAIACDSTYITAYLNLAIAYDRDSSYTKEMAAYNKLLNLIPNDAGLLEQKGMLLERMGKQDSAKKYYSISATAFRKGLAKDPANDKLIVEMVELKSITEGKDSAKKELDDQVRKHPEIYRKVSYEYEMLNLFNRENVVFHKQIESDKRLFSLISILFCLKTFNRHQL